MGVHGLWRLIEPSGKTVPVETLENKVLAVDVSIWLHQAIKGFQDAKGQPLPNAHLLGIYHRVCKLLYFRVKPVFVFDGGVPALKKQTIAKRNQQKARNFNATGRLHKQLLSTLLKHSAVNKVLSEKARASIEASCDGDEEGKKSDLFALPPPPPPPQEDYASSEESDFDAEESPTKQWDIHSIDMDSAHFRALPADVRHEILTEMKETRKQSSWGRLHELPAKSDDFAVFQLNRLRKRYQVQVSLEEAEKEMGGHSLSLAQLEQLLNDQGVITKNLEIGSRIASDENARYLLIKDVKKAMDDARRETAAEAASSTTKTKADLEFESDMRRAIELSQKDEQVESTTIEDDSDLQEAIKLSLQCEQPSSSQIPPPSFEQSYINSTSSDSEDDTNNTLTSAKNYMMEYSGLTPAEIAKIIGKQVKSSKQTAKRKTSEEATKETTKDTKRTDSQEQVSSSTIAGEQTSKELQTSSEETKKIEFQEHVSSSTTAEDVEIMSGSDSDSLENLIDASNQSAGQSSGLEIVIKPTDKLEDDLFSDIFDENPTSEVYTSNEVPSEVAANTTSERPKVQTLADSYRNQAAVATSELETTVKSSTRGVVALQTEEEPNFLGFEDEEISQAANKTRTPSTYDGIIVHPSINPTSETVLSHVIAPTSEATIVDASSDPTSEVLLTAGESPTSEVRQSETTVENHTETLSQPSPSKRSRNEVILEKQKTVDAIRQMLKSVKESDSSEATKVSVEELKQVQKNLSQESKELKAEKATKERMAGNITDQMYQEAQELLELFGVPYVVAPMEAEAQCAFLDAIGLTDGTITDDSDIWLFGGKTVYKNFFNQSKHVMEFKAENIQHCFKLTREQMVLLALLVGSDYTTGVQGVGPVTALEILAAFPMQSAKEFQLSHSELLSGLAEFRRWYQGKATKGPARNSLRRKLKNLELGENFPSIQVVQAYLDPQVETSEEAFSWAKPDVVGLIDFAREKFGWTRKKSEEILKPVLKRLEERFAQTSILDYFQRKHKIDCGELEKGVSKRVKKAVEKIGKVCDDDDDDDGEKSQIEDKEKKSGSTKEKKSRVSRKQKKDLEATSDPESEKRKKQKKVENKRESESLEGPTAASSSRKKPPVKKKTSTSLETNQKTSLKLEQDPDIKVLQQTRARSRRRLAQMEEDAKEKMQEEKARKTRISSVLHTKEVIIQKELDKKNVLRSKLKAIEVFRKSKQGPGYVKKRQRKVLEPKADAELSESDGSD